MSLQQTALTKAIQILDALKLPYAVLDGDTKYGGLEVKPVKPEKIRHRVSPQYDHQSKFKYPAAMDAAKMGDVLSFTADHDDEANSLRGSVGSYAVRNWGPGSIISEKKGRTISVMVIHKP